MEKLRLTAETLYYLVSAGSLVYAWYRAWKRDKDSK